MVRVPLPQPVGMGTRPPVLACTPRTPSLTSALSLHSPPPTPQVFQFLLLIPRGLWSGPRLPAALTETSFLEVFPHSPPYTGVCGKSRGGGHEHYVPCGWRLLESEFLTGQFVRASPARKLRGGGGGGGGISTPLLPTQLFHSIPLRSLISQEAKEAKRRNEKSNGLLLWLSEGFTVHLSTLSKERKNGRGNRRVEAFQPIILE